MILALISDEEEWGSGDIHECKGFEKIKYVKPIFP